MGFSKSFIGILALLSLSVSLPAWSCPGGLTAWVRNRSGKLVQRAVSINGLENGTFETKNFKIVVGESDQAVSLDDAHYCARASHVLYTLEQARSKIASELGEGSVSWMPQITVRLEMENLFSSVVHFQADSRGEIYNDSLSVPASGSERIDSVAP